jgi:hypothetical protein
MRRLLCTAEVGDGALVQLTLVGTVSEAIEAVLAEYPDARGFRVRTDPEVGCVADWLERVEEQAVQ